MNVRLLIATMVCVVAMPSLAFDKLSASRRFQHAHLEMVGGKSVALVRSWPETATLRNLPGAIQTLESPYRLATKGVAGDKVSFDPGDILEEHLAPLMIQQYGMLRAPGKPLVAKAHWKDVAAVPGDADYLLYIRTTAQVIDRKGNVLKGKGWTGVGLRVALVERATATPLLLTDCYSDTRDRADLTRVNALTKDDMRLNSDIVASLAWHCMRRLGEVLLPEPAAVPRTPAELVDPLADYARANPKK